MPGDRTRRYPQDRLAGRNDRAYWLARCQGFDVEAGGREVGVVREVRYESRADVPDVIAVRTGHLRRGLLLIPIEQVQNIDAYRGRLELVAGAATCATKRRHLRLHPPARRRG